MVGLASSRPRCRQCDDDLPPAPRRLAGLDGRRGVRLRGGWGGARAALGPYLMAPHRLRLPFAPTQPGPCITRRGVPSCMQPPWLRRGGGGGAARCHWNPSPTVAHSNGMQQPEPRRRSLPPSAAGERGRRGGGGSEGAWLNPPPAREQGKRAPLPVWGKRGVPWLGLTRQKERGRRGARPQRSRVAGERRAWATGPVATRGHRQISNGGPKLRRISRRLSPKSGSCLRAACPGPGSVRHLRPGPPPPRPQRHVATCPCAGNSILSTLTLPPSFPTTSRMDDEQEGKERALLNPRCLWG